MRRQVLILRLTLMKKAISILLAVLMLASLGTTTWAEEETELTPGLVLDRLAQEEEVSETPEEQAANGALRLAEMVIALDNLGIETQEEADHLNRMLDMLTGVDVPEESLEHKLAAGAMKTFEALMIFLQQADPDGNYAEELQQVFDSFLANDDKADGAKQQAINGLYHSVIISSVIARGFCRNQAAASQIESELASFYEADKSDTGSDVEQLVLGSETLFRMLTAISSLVDTDGSFFDELREISENAYSADSEAEDAIFKLANWLYGCVYMTELIARELYD